MSVALPAGLGTALHAVPDPPAWLWVLLVLAPVVVLLAGAVSLVRVVPPLHRARDGEGVVVEVGDQGAGAGPRLWRLTVEYRDSDGTLQRGVWRGDSRLDRSLYTVGMRVPLRYDPRRPEWVHVPGGARPHPLLVPVGLLVVGLLALVPVAVAAGVLGSV